MKESRQSKIKLEFGNKPLTAKGIQRFDAQRSRYQMNDSGF